MTATLDLPRLPALVVGRVEHVRHMPLRHAFGYRHYQWLVDLDDLPRRPAPLRWLTRFDARDHLDGGAHGGLREDLAHLLASEGTQLAPSDRIVMLAHARVLGHVFDPLSVFWVLTSQGQVRATVFEVHNTYGGRHSYVLDVDTAGRAATEKVFTVSPFNDRSGRYEIRIRLDQDRCAVSIVLHREGQRVITATTHGRIRPATDREVVRTSLRHLPMTWRVSALIRVHGIWLWARRLPIQPRPHSGQEATR